MIGGLLSDIWANCRDELDFEVVKIVDKTIIVILLIYFNNFSMSERDPIIHDYVGKPEEQEMLDKLAAARCKVRTSTVESQSNQN